MAQNKPSTAAQLINVAAEGAGDTTDAARRAAVGAAVLVLEQVKDILGVAGFVADLSEVTVTDLITRCTKFVETGERPTPHR